ncbi:UDP-forming cellulose synthase catalytic subunit [Pseudooceanicola nanhaiensis]|uniref:UDP-forming cellulose synthase catalytic subunit n=1 Tax=Pseudooceanicola nanhaiensis TaxID=375761 RepID=UPI001CD80F0E|nr:UDP-forming cellulose synthase catalytic subunit [Pseudooceanicola nanhaiensis]MCA0922217.1 UDP-forming cellulose synthase catalytic subunit [Pseudooceanicola nanhaiensis]
MSGGRLLSALGAPLMFLLWIVALVPVVFLASVPTSVGTQGLVAFASCCVIYLLKPAVHSNMIVRFVVLSVAGTFVLRYWLWRLFETLPSAEDPVSLGAALVLFAAETFTVGVFFLTALISADPIDHPKPAPVRLEDVPTVDILVPSYDESPELLAVTLEAAKQVSYPEGKKTVVLCDDGGTEQRCNSTDPALREASRLRRATLQKLCADLGVVYTTRERNEHAKAGNLNAAMEKLHGDLVLVLDADHVPTRDILTRTVGYFAENPKLFLVQTPHFFTNRDPIERNLRLPETAPSENEMFYSQIHRGLDRLGGAFFCGSAAILRRQALDEVGGISGETITEDAETALDIHSRGWESMYLDHAMVAGLQPETFASFIQQRGRWATGMIQMLILKNPLFRPGLSFMQRMCYLNSMSFWLFPVIRIIFLLSPLLYLFFGLEIFVVSTQEVMAYIVPYLLVGMMVQNALFGGVRWPQISETYEIAQTPYLLKAVFSTMLRPRGATFKVTAKDDSVDNAFLSPIFGPLTALVALLVAGLAAAVFRWIAFPGDRVVVEIVGAWNLYNFLLAAYALRAVFERPSRLVRPRTAAAAPAHLSWEKTTLGDEEERPELDATIVSASPRQIVLKLPPHVSSQRERSLREGAATGIKAVLTASLPKAPDLEAPLTVSVRSVHADPSGTHVELAVAPEEMVAASRLTAHVVYGDSLRWHFFRKVQPQSSTLLGGVIYVLGQSLMSLPKTLFDFLREPTRRERSIEDDVYNPDTAFMASSEERRPTAAAAAQARPQPVKPSEYLTVEE